MTRRKQNYAICVAFFAMLFLAMNVIGVRTAVSQIVPPKGLAWGMSFEDVKIKLETEQEKDRMKLEKAKEEKKLFPGFLTAKIKDAKVLDEKVDRAYAIFDKEEKLVAIYFVFAWDNDEEAGLVSAGGKGRKKCWELHQKLFEGFVAKYEEPAKNDVTEDKVGNPIAEKTWLETKFPDEDGNEILLALTRVISKPLGITIDQYQTYLFYQSQGYVKAKKAGLTKSADY